MWKHARFQRVFMGRHIKHGVPWCPRRDTWTPRGLHVSMFFPGSATSWVFGVGPMLTWGDAWTLLEMTWTSKFFDVSCNIADVELALRGDVWFRGRRVWHVDVMWDILRDGWNSFREFFRCPIVLFDGLCDNRMFCVVSYSTLQTIRVCFAQNRTRLFMRMSCSKRARLDVHDCLSYSNTVLTCVVWRLEHTNVRESFLRASMGTSNDGPCCNKPWGRRVDATNNSLSKTIELIKCNILIDKTYCNHMAAFTHQSPVVQKFNQYA